MGEFGLDLDNILSDEEVGSLLDDNTDNNDTKTVDTEDNNEDKNKTTEIHEDELFDGSESVGSEEEDNKVKEDINTNSVGSPNDNFYSSIANACAVDGIFPDLDEESISKVKTPEDFAELIKQQIKSGLDERQKRIDDALNAGVEPSLVKQYEGAIDYLDNIDDDVLSEESDEGENLRKRLIYQDYINRGFSQKRAEKMVNDAIEKGTDIEDAKDALQGNKDYFNNKYKELLDEAKEEEKKAKEAREAQTNKVKDEILKGKNLFGDVDLDKNTRQKIFDNMAKPTFKSKDGQYMTELQKYQSEKPMDFLKYVSICYTITDGFKDFGKLGAKQAKKEIKKGLANLTKVINTTSRDSNGNLSFVSGVDENTYIGKGMKLDF